MKTGLSLQQLAAEIQRQQDSKQDFIVNTPALSAVVIDEDGTIHMNAGEHSFGVTNPAHGQIASHLKIPKRYYDRMLEEQPGLLAQNVNTWLHQNQEKRLVRTLDGNMRAFLSDRYRMLDNFDLLTAVLPVLQDMNVTFESQQVTEHHMYLKVWFPELESEVPNSKQVGDVVRGGIVISNSEIGAGSLRIEPLLYRLVCTNGMIRASSMKKYHVGRGNGSSVEDIMAVLTDETRQVTDQAFWMQVRDVVKHSVNLDFFNQEIQIMGQAAQDKLEGSIQATVEVVQKKFGLNDGQGQDILKHLIQEGDLTKWGLANAITRTAQDQKDYEEATHMERLGGKLIDLTGKDWKEIKEAA